jgi:hypothetical protein
MHNLNLNAWSCRRNLKSSTNIFFYTLPQFNHRVTDLMPSCYGHQFITSPVARIYQIILRSIEAIHMHMYSICIIILHALQE